MRAPSDVLRELALLVGPLTVLVLLVVWIPLVVALWRFRAARAGEPSETEEHTRLEIAWTAAPLVIVAVLFVATLVAMREIGVIAAPQPGVTGEVRIRATGVQWWWEFEYPNGAVNANELHLPVGVPVVLELHSRDVIHSFWIPELGHKVDMIPGNVNVLRLFARRPGVYTGACTEYCGIQHAWMRIVAVAQPRDEFQAWMADQATPPEPDPEAFEVFRQNLCAACHTIKGTPADGKAGPDLTHFGSRLWIGAGVLPNTAEGRRRWLEHTQEVKPGALMPTMPLTDEHLEILVRYLGSLR